MFSCVRYPYVHQDSCVIERDKYPLTLLWFSLICVCVYKFLFSFRMFNASKWSKYNSVTSVFTVPLFEEYSGLSSRLCKLLWIKRKRVIWCTWTLRCVRLWKGKLCRTFKGSIGDNTHLRRNFSISYIMLSSNKPRWQVTACQVRFPYRCHRLKTFSRVFSCTL